MGAIERGNALAPLLLIYSLNLFSHLHNCCIDFCLAAAFNRGFSKSEEVGVDGGRTNPRPHIRVRKIVAFGQMYLNTVTYFLTN